MTMVKKKNLLKIKQIRSGIGRPIKHKSILRGLGLRRLNQIVLRADTPEIRGMIAKIPHLVTIVNQDNK